MHPLRTSGSDGKNAMSPGLVVQVCDPGYLGRKTKAKEQVQGQPGQLDKNLPCAISCDAPRSPGYCATLCLVGGAVWAG